MIYIMKPSVNLPNRRFGSTLAEVLMSLAVMSIGVVSLAAIFPISVLRSVQATQLTNATNLRYNAEALLGPVPQFYSIGATWQPSTAYAAGALVIPTPLTSLKSPPAVFQCITAGSSGSTEPAWNFGNGLTTNDPAGSPSPVQWKTFILQNYVVDPLGESLDSSGNPLVESQYRQTRVNGDFFGNDGTTPYQSIRAFSGFANRPSVTVADALATLPDSWIGQFESRKITAFTTTSCTFGDVPNGNTIPTLPPAVTVPPAPVTNWRIVLFDITGKTSEVRPVTSTSNPSPYNVATINWANSLPSGFTPVQARLETQSRRYTWMLSVRRGLSGVAYMDAVIFFNRSFSGKDEQVYPATFTATTDFGSDAKPGISGIDDDGNGVVDFLGTGAPDPAEIGWPGSDDAPRNWVIVQYNSGGTKPFFKKGGFVTDVDNLRWYRIIDIVEGGATDTPTTLLTRQATGISALTGLNPSPFSTTAYAADAFVAGFDRAVFLRLDTPVSQSGSQPTVSGGAPNGKAILMRGIIDVYPLRTQQTWGN